VKRWLTAGLLALLGCGTITSGASEARGSGSRRGVPEAAASDDVTRLMKRITAGEVALGGSDHEILAAVLRELHVPVESQMAVFSRTSMQAGLVRPANPRVLYFSDTTYVGWVPGGLIEVAAIDPETGVNFYALDPQDARENRRTFVRETSCLRCHGGGMMERNPVLFARSVFTTERGEPLRDYGFDLVTEQTPFERRWGGWYVTGYAGRENHRGNAFSRERDGRLEFAPSESRPVDLAGFVDTARYLAATSDIVALLIFEHQIAAQNSLLRAGRAMREALGTPSDQVAIEAVVATSAEDVLDHLLFRHSAPLPDGVKGAGVFARHFAASAPRSGDGHSLKDLSLRGRVFANRCSYVIYSELFATLPGILRDRVLAALAQALRDDASGRYAYLEPDERRRIRVILDETLPAAQLSRQEWGGPEARGGRRGRPATR
jgi:hypothetical protein